MYEKYIEEGYSMNSQKLARQLVLIARELVSKNKPTNDDVMKFLVNHPDPKHSTIKDWADHEGFDAQEVEAIMFVLATKMAVFLRDGRANEKGYTEKNAPKDELKMGIEVEKEHTPDIDIRKRIALDHLAETEKYYTGLAKMERELGVEEEEE